MAFCRWQQGAEYLRDVSILLTINRQKQSYSLKDTNKYQAPRTFQSNQQLIQYNLMISTLLIICMKIQWINKCYKTKTSFFDDGVVKAINGIHLEENQLKNGKPLIRMLLHDIGHSSILYNTDMTKFCIKTIR